MSVSARFMVMRFVHKTADDSGNVLSRGQPEACWSDRFVPRTGKRPLSDVACFPNLLLLLLSSRRSSTLPTSPSVEIVGDGVHNDFRISFFCADVTDHEVNPKIFRARAYARRAPSVQASRNFLGKRTLAKACLLARFYGCHRSYQSEPKSVQFASDR